MKQRTQKPVQTQHQQQVRHPLLEGKSRGSQEKAGVLGQCPASIPVLRLIPFPRFSVRLGQKQQNMGKRVHPEETGGLGDFRIIFSNIRVDFRCILGIVEGLIRDFHRLGNAPLSVEIVVQRLRAQSHPLSLQGKAVGHRHILADPAFRVAHILKQLPAVELVAGAGIAAVVAEDSAREGHAGKALVAFGAQTDFLLAGFFLHVITSAAGKLGIPLYEGGQEGFVHL